MIVGTGIDLVEIWRIERAVHRHADRFLRRVFTEGEIAYCGSGKMSGPRLAARFAAKEAAAKALGTGFGRGIRLCEIEVVRDASGRPELVFHGAASRRADELGVSRRHLSLTHSLSQAAAVVVLESETAR